MKKTLGLVVSLLFLSSTAAIARMNVVLFLIDDLGWKDLGCQGSDYYKTPNIDRLAAGGVRFTDAYAACNVCSPTRAAVLTGKYPARLMLTQWLPAGRWDPSKYKMREGRFIRELPLEEVTLAEALREAGYRNGFVGKWHLGGAPFYLPQHQGFDVNVAGDDHGAPGHYFYPYKGRWLIPTTGQYVEKQTLKDGKPGEYLTDRLTEEAVDFVRSSRDQPFFLMLSHYAVHTPLQAKEDVKARYEKVPKKERQGNPAYAAMVESVDDSVGRVMDVLEELKIRDETLILFTSDNGGFAKATSNEPLRANKGSNYEGGLRVPFIVSWPGVTDKGAVCSEPVISNDIYPTVLDVLGLPAKPEQHMDGVSLVPALKGGKLPTRDLCWHYPHYNQHPQSAPSGVIRSGHWKLIEFYEAGTFELYNVEEDLGEKADVFHKYPDVAAMLTRKLLDWRNQVGADPMKSYP